MDGQSGEDRADAGPAGSGRIGRYQIRGELGRGAMGVVYLAIDPAIGRQVAIKTIRIRDIHNEAQQQKLRERLFREARSAGVLSHPNIVTIYDMDEDEGVAYIAMEFVNGPPLDKALAGPMAVSGSETLRILRQCASALDYAHSRGVIHRDVKPGNIMLDEERSVKITDFGIAKITAPSNTTETRSVTGTPSYMSPEQVQGLPVDGRSDQFSLAVIAYEILTGERPFHGEHLSTIVYRIVAEEPTEAHRINDALTRQIDAVLRRALAKKPENRFPNCASFVGALEMACAESGGWKTIAAGAAPAMPTTVMEPARPEAEPKPIAAPRLGGYEKPRPSRSAAGPILAGVVVALGLGAVFAWEAGVLPGFDNLIGQPATQAPVAPVASTPPVAAEEVPKPSPLVTAPVPEEPAETAGAPASPANPSAVPRLQDVWVTTNPPGAKVVFDDNTAAACIAPCMLHGPAGVHKLTYTLGGYQSEYREIRVGATAVDAPLVSLRQPGGTLMLTTTPPGASIRIDGKAVSGATPAQISLAPGMHTVTVEQDGRSQSQQVEIQESPVYLRFTLSQ